MLDGCTPSPPEVAERYRRLGYWRGQTLGELLDAWVDAFDERVAIIGNGERITYRDLGRRVDRLALHLLGFGLRSPERVVIQLPNVPELVVLYYACVKVGLIPVLALPAHRYSEIAHLTQFSKAAAYVIPDQVRGFDYRGLARDVRQAVPVVRHVMAAGEVDDDDMDAFGALLSDPLSGGTTGLPKVIPRTHDDYAYNSRASAVVSGFGPNTVYMVSLPASHNFPLACPGIQGTLMHGGTVILLNDPDPAEAFAMIERERVTATSLVPALAIR